MASRRTIRRQDCQRRGRQDRVCRLDWWSGERIASQITVDADGSKIGNNDSADDMRNVDLTRIHYLTGPFEIETAEPGDVLVLEIEDVQPMDDQPWGFTGVFDRKNVRNKS